MKIMMSKHESLECSGGAHWGGLALMLACGVAQIGCGNASKKECADSVIVSFTGECPGSDGSGATGTGEGGAGATSVGTSGSGGSSSKPGHGGAVTGGAAPVAPEPELVFQWGDPEHEGRLDAGDWFVDNSQGAHVGGSAVHPPKLLPGQEVSMSFDCGGQEHTQLSFALRRLSGSTELELFDGPTSRGIIIADGGWNGFVFDVPQGIHDYKLTVRNTGTAEIGVPYVLDSFVCKNAESTEGPNGFVTFDDAFIPLELGGTWFVDNLQGAHQGEAAVHPTPLGPGADSSMTFDCGGREHTQLSFVLRRLTGSTELELFDGETSRGVIVADGGWNGFVFDVPAGKHEYTLIARNTGTAAIGTPFVLDTFACKFEESTQDPEGYVTFDAGFIPIEIEGSWFVDNLHGTHQGEAAVHPPALEPGTDSSMTFDCTDPEHTTLSFVLRRLTGNTELLLLDGTKERDTLVKDGGWNALVYEAEPGSRQYTFTARNTGATRLQAPFVLDTFRCE